jgi:hypothetical protein
MKRSPILFLLLTLLLAPAAARAVNGAGETSGLSLLLPLGARPTALGGAYVAVASGADSLLWNPAGLNQLRDWELGLGHLSYVQGVSDDLIQVARPIYGLGAFAIGATYLSAGSQQFYDVFGNNTAADGSPLGSFSVDDFSAQVALAVQMPDDLSVGLTYKILREEYNQGAMGSAFDLGVQWRDLLGKSLDLGFAAQNLGTPIALGSTYYDLEMAFRLGLAYHPAPGLLLTVEEDFRPWNAPGAPTIFTESVNRVHMGAEWAVPVGDWSGAVRAGYIIGPEQDQGALGGLSVGGGVTLGSWQVDYAWVPMGDLGSTHRLSLTYTVGE